MINLSHRAQRPAGPIQAVILDWAGTTVDHGSIAPVMAFVETFRLHGVEIEETIARLRERGVRIGSTTGYNRQMMNVLVPEATRRGFQPESIVCVSDVPAGRPEPWMALRDVPKTILLTQAVNHATEHRAQIMAILTQLEIEPPELDGWSYFDEREP